MTPQDIESYLASLYEKMYKRQPALMNDVEIRMHPDFASIVGWANGQLLTKYQLPLVLDDVIPIKDGQSDIYILDPKYLDIALP